MAGVSLGVGQLVCVLGVTNHVSPSVSGVVVGPMDMVASVGRNAMQLALAKLLIRD
jgi:hypothetical protein